MPPGQGQPHGQAQQQPQQGSHRPVAAARCGLPRRRQTRQQQQRGRGAPGGVLGERDGSSSVPAALGPAGPQAPTQGGGLPQRPVGFSPPPKSSGRRGGSRVGTKRSPLLRSSPPNLQGDNRGCVRPWAPQDPPSLLRSRSLGCSHSQGCPTLPRHPLSPHSVFGVLTIPECGWSRSCCCGVSGAGGPPALPAPPAADVSMRGGRGGEGG